MTRILALLHEKTSKTYWHMYGTHFLVLGGPMQGPIIFLLLVVILGLRSPVVHIFCDDYLCASFGPKLSDFNSRRVSK